jgi:hypothetical protein
MIAIEARRIAYFNYSLQKMITYVANVVKVPAQNHTFFNRFLAL